MDALSANETRLIDGPNDICFAAELAALQVLYLNDILLELDESSYKL